MGSDLEEGRKIGREKREISKKAVVRRQWRRHKEREREREKQ